MRFLPVILLISGLPNAQSIYSEWTSVSYCFKNLEFRLPSDGLAFDNRDDSAKLCVQAVFFNDVGYRLTKNERVTAVIPDRKL